MNEPEKEKEKPVRYRINAKKLDKFTFSSSTTAAEMILVKHPELLYDEEKMKEIEEINPKVAKKIKALFIEDDNTTTPSH
ncbi:MAG: hypothetical protein ACYCSO_04930 [Cuniculiplasma sp.]